MVSPPPLVSVGIGKLARVPAGGAVAIAAAPGSAAPAAGSAAAAAGEKDEKEGRSRMTTWPVPLVSRSHE